MGDLEHVERAGGHGSPRKGSAGGEAGSTDLPQLGLRRVHARQPATISGVVDLPGPARPGDPARAARGEHQRSWLATDRAGSADQHVLRLVERREALTCYPRRQVSMGWVAHGGSAAGVAHRSAACPPL